MGGARYNRERTRRVWAAVTRRPCATLRELGAEVGMAPSVVLRHLRALRGLGYVEFEDGRQQGRRIVVGLGDQRPARRPRKQQRERERGA